ncbi:predicted protein [Nematostella vectensis]|uniref:separase n=1 Tax=Nematostella vectensis TaxID=45351 RepID=A7RYA6_NEMVE|nr:predicted protein [Nematostella vectensis]|eukprot:XP_001635666.1 predicted protein [Nematostella vectensis]
MEGERILKDLSRMKFDGLYVDTKNYLGCLRSLVDNDGFVLPKGCNTAEKTVIKYGTFCNKFLRCGLELLKSLKDTSPETEELLGLLRFVVKILENVMKADNGHYLPSIPLLGEILKKFMILGNYLLGKDRLEDAFYYTSTCYKCLELAINKTSIQQDTSISLAKSLASIAWKGGQLAPRSKSKGKETKEHSSYVTLLWRMCALQAEILANEAVHTVVTKAFKVASKFQLECESESLMPKLLDFYQALFKMLSKRQCVVDSLESSESLYSLFELGFHFTRTCQYQGEIEMGQKVLNELQDSVNQALKPKLTNTVNGSTISRFCACVCCVIKASLLVESKVLNRKTLKKSQLSKEFIELNKQLSEAKRLLGLLIESTTKASFPISTIIMALEGFKSSILPKNSGKEKKSSESKFAVDFPAEVFEVVDTLMLGYHNLLELQKQSLVHVMGRKDEVVSSQKHDQLRQQLQRTSDRQLSLYSFVMSLYRHRLEQGDNGPERRELLLKCRERAEKGSGLIHSLLQDNSVTVSENELLWHGSECFSIGYCAYKQDLFMEATCLMSVGCQCLKEWCWSARGNKTYNKQKVLEVATKYQLLSDCLVRTQSFPEALSSSTISVMLLLSAAEYPEECSSEMHQAIFSWVKTKHKFVKHAQLDDADSIRTRTLCQAMADEDMSTDLSIQQLALILQEELSCYSQSSNRYDLTVEQLSVIQQLMGLYREDEDTFKLACFTLEYAKILQTTDCTSDTRPPLEYCQEAVTILEGISEDILPEDPSFAGVQEELGAAFLLQSIAQHGSTMREGPSRRHEPLNTSDADGTGVSDGQEEQQVALNQAYIQSLHAAVDAWTAMVDSCLKQSTCNTVELTCLRNPLETINSVRQASVMYALLNQPLNQAHALHLFALIATALGTPEAMSDAVVAYAQAVHSLCSIQDVYHARQMVRRMEEAAVCKPTPLANIHLMLARSGYLLLVGKFSEGSECLRSVLSSEILSKKTASSYVVLATARVLQAQYMALCPEMLTPPTPSGVSSVHHQPATPLECLSDGCTWVEVAATAIFGQSLLDVDSTAVCKVGSDECLRLTTLHILLHCQLQLGAMLTRLGVVKQAAKFLADGLALAGRFHLPYRVIEFKIFQSELDIQIHKLDRARSVLLGVASQMAPLFHGTTDRLEDLTDVHAVVSHKDTCRCMCCSDPALQAIQIRVLLVLARFFQASAAPKVSVNCLEGAEVLCNNAVARSKRTLDEITNMLRLGVSEPCETDKAPRTKSKGKSKKAKKDDSAECPITTAVTAKAMYGVYFAEVFVLNAEILLSRGKLTKARDVTAAGLDTVEEVRRVFGAVSPYCSQVNGNLLYLKGLTYLLSDSAFAELNNRWDSCAPDTKQHCSPSDVSSNKIDVRVPDADNEKTLTKAQARKGRRGKAVVNEESELTEKVTKKPAKRRGKSAQLSSLENSVQNGDIDIDGQPSKRSSRSRAKASKVDGFQEALPSSRRAKGRAKSINENVDEDKGDHLQVAMEYLTRALDLTQPLPDPRLYSSICRVLALCYGRVSPSDAAHYSNQSLGVTLRQEALNSSRKKLRRLMKEISTNEKSSMNDMDALADEMSHVSLSDDPSVMTACRRLLQIRETMAFSGNEAGNPSDLEFAREWTVCTIDKVSLPGITPSYLMVTRLRNGSAPVVLRLALPDDSEGTESSGNDHCEAASKAVMDLCKLFQGSVDESFADVLRDSAESMNISSTKEWCQRRSNLDDSLKNVLERLERSWLGKWRGVILGRHSMPGVEETLHSCSADLCEALGSRAGKKCDVHLIQILLDAYSSLSRYEISEALSYLTGLQQDSDKLPAYLEVFTNTATEYTSLVNQILQKSSLEAVRRHPVILILGKGVQHLPWENIPILRDHEVTRMPSLQFVLSHAQQMMHQPCSVDPEKTYFVLNPDDNLPNTQKLFQKWFEGEPGWRGVTGTKPSQEQYRSALVDNDLFLYLGHGNGRTFLNGSEVQRLNCRSTAILMGCSSGKLIVEGVCEPRGMVLNYLIAGCPAVVANLWDVTDRDIDRLTATLLKTWLQRDHSLSLAQALCQARKACKLGYLIGASPVVYGIPVYRKR